MTNIIQNKILISLFIAILLYFLNFHNNHGDYKFFLQFYYEVSELKLIDVFPKFYGISEETIHYGSSEDLFKLIFFTASKFINYNFLTFFSHFFLFHSLFNLLDNKKIQNYLILIILLSNFYMFSIALASIKNCMSLTFLFYSVYFYKNSRNNLFLIFFLISTCISAYTLIIYLLLSILYFDQTKNFFKKNILLKILILFLPILINQGLILGKIGGYTDEEVWRKYKVTKNQQLQNKENNLTGIYSTQNNTFQNFINKFNNHLNKKKSIKIFSINTDFVSKKYGPWFIITDDNKKISKNFYLTFSIKDLIKLFLLNILIYSFLNPSRRKIFSFYLIISVFLFSLINFTRFTLMLNVIYLISLSYHEDLIKKNTFRYYIILIFCCFGFVKSLLLVSNLILYNEIY